MAVLNIRNLPEHVHKRLRIRAARAGRSMEAEARLILEHVCREEESQPEPSPEDLVAWVDNLYGNSRPVGVVDDFLAERRREGTEE